VNSTKYHQLLVIPVFKASYLYNQDD